MVQRVVQTFVSDLSGSEANVKRVEFSLDGVEYEIDLDHEEQQQLRDALGMYIRHSRRMNRTVRRSPGRRTGAVMTRHATGESRPEKGKSREIRMWAESQNIEVSSNGRIPRDVVDAYFRNN